MYQLVMAQGYFQMSRHNDRATYDYFYRRNPYGGGYALFAGLSELLDILKNWKFTEEDTTYLFHQGIFHAGFLSYLRDFQFKGDIYSVREGEVVFPNEPILRIEGGWLECQLLETLLLNIINFSTLIATKAARIKQVVNERPIIDMGLRRAQGLGGILASKAAIIGGATSTSNVYAAKKYDLLAVGTMAHAWILGFENELTAFRAFAKEYPHNTVLLVDTYDTLKSGVPNAIIVAKELEANGCKLHGIRLDSGDFAYLSKKARNLLDEANLSYVKIVASNQLDEYVIRSLEEQDAPIDIYGVGTNLIIGAGAGAHDGVYKLSSIQGQPKMKFSDNPEKATLPGPKDLYRYYNNDGTFYGDGITCAGMPPPKKLYDPVYPDRLSDVGDLKNEALLIKCVENGKVVITNPIVRTSRLYAESRLQSLGKEFTRFENPHIYKVGVSDILLKHKTDMIAALRK
jgi:nicotinate phosphoribosyltransferase